MIKVLGTKEIYIWVSRFNAWGKIRVLRGIVYILTKIEARTEPWVRHRKGDREVKLRTKNCEMISKF